MALVILSDLVLPGSMHARTVGDVLRAHYEQGTQQDELYCISCVGLMLFSI